jgi:uncharacterized delta-60 repeat protein
MEKRMNSFIRTFTILLSILIFTLASPAAGEVDPTFNASVHVDQNDVVKVIVTQPDGKHLIGGNFTVINGAARIGIARINADGTIDNSFFPPVFYDIQTSALGSTIKTIALQADGKILVGGKFLIAGSMYRSLVRLNSNGSIDNTFNVHQFSNFEVINKILVSADGSIYIGGDMLMNRGDGWYNHKIIKLNSNGSPNPTFAYEPQSNEVKNLVEQADGKIVYSDIALGQFPNIKRINADGTADNSFGIFAAGGGVERLVRQPDDKILACGNFTSVNGFTYNGVARINANGSIDVNFNTNGAGVNVGAFVLDVAVASDGKIYIGGEFNTFNGTARNKLAKLNADGSLDSSFNFPAVLTATTIIREIEVLSSGKILVAGANTVSIAPPSNDTISRVNTDGSIDSTFSTKAGRAGKVREVVPQSDGKILIVGEFTLVNGVARNSMARLNADGSLDTSFVPYFNSSLQAQVLYAVAVQPDGKILVGGVGGGGIGFKRLNPDGSQDGTFNPPTTTLVYDVIVLPNNKILVVNNRFVIRLESNGTVDGTFSALAPNGTAVYKIYFQPDGKVLFGGDFTQVGTTNRGRIARYNTDGTLDMSFNPPGGANNVVYDIDLEPSGKIILGGAFSSLNGGMQAGVGRLNPDGSLDNTFAQIANVNVLAVKLQPDGKILIGGQFTVVGGLTKNGIARLNSNGSLDPAFNTTALIAVTDINLQADNKILLGGDFTEINNTSQVGISRLLNSLAAPKTFFDFDGDGKADVSVFRPSTNRWYVFKSSDSTVSEMTFGLAGDVAAPADYDGDGKTDLAIFRASSGDWWYLSSINGAQIFAHWGANGDIPRPSDFDSDGKADFIIFRPSNNVWYRLGSTGANSITPFGLAGDKPVSGDFDGDGKSDLAIFRPSTGDWWYQSSVNNAQLAVRWGISTDVPAPADYDGDGKTDFAVYRPSTGVWYIINSNNGSFLIMQFGIAEDKPVPADYDGDGKADIAVFRPSTGIWYQMKTTAGFSAQQFGVSTDIPTENAFVP